MADMLQPRTSAPDFALPDSLGNLVKLSDFRGKYVVLAFYPADFSPVCTSQFCQYRDVLGEIRGADAEVIGISVDDPASHRAWAEELGITFPLVSDSSPPGAVARQYGVFREQNNFTDRALFFIDRDGVIRQTWRGEHPGIEPPITVVYDALNAMRRERE